MLISTDVSMSWWFCFFGEPCLTHPCSGGTDSELRHCLESTWIRSFSLTTGGRLNYSTTLENSRTVPRGTFTCSMTWQFHAQAPLRGRLPCMYKNVRSRTAQRSSAETGRPLKCGAPWRVTPLSKRRNCRDTAMDDAPQLNLKWKSKS